LACVFQDRDASVFVLEELYLMTNELKQPEQRVIDSKYFSNSVMLELKTIYTFINRMKQIEKYLQSNPQQIKMLTRRKINLSISSFITTDFLTNQISHFASETEI